MYLKQSLSSMKTGQGRSLSSGGAVAPEAVHGAAITDPRRLARHFANYFSSGKRPASRRPCAASGRTLSRQTLVLNGALHQRLSDGRRAIGLTDSPTPADKARRELLDAWRHCFTTTFKQIAKWREGRKTIRVIDLVQAAA
jgi:hypothetical protein